MDILNSNKLEKLIKNYNENKKNNIIKSAVFKTKISELVQQPEKIKQNQNIFSIDIKTMPVTYQKQSGRCWIFAGCNILCSSFSIASLLTPNLSKKSFWKVDGRIERKCSALLF